MDDRELIRLRAYEIWIREGQPEGRELEHWMQARRELFGSAAERRDENRAHPETPPGQPSDDDLRQSTELG